MSLIINPYRNQPGQREARRIYLLKGHKLDLRWHISDTQLAKLDGRTETLCRQILFAVIKKTDFESIEGGEHQLMCEMCVRQFMQAKDVLTPQMFG